MKDLNPVVYDTSLEKSEPGESAAAGKLTHTIEQISQTTTKDYGHAMRSLHGFQGLRRAGRALARMVYAKSSGLRRQFNGCPMHEPKSVDLEK
jgi:hypothetical protein